MRWWVLCCLLCCLVVCFRFGREDVQRRALRAFDASILLLSQDDEDGETHVRGVPTSPVADRAPARTVAKGDARASTRRKRITPFIAKRVAARQRWRCATCHEILTEDFEVDHVVSLQRRLAMGQPLDNDLDGLQALHKRCHLLKNSLEQRRG
jgi:hypothetical protein